MKRNQYFTITSKFTITAPPATLLCYRYAEGAERVGGRERPALLISTLKPDKKSLTLQTSLFNKLYLLN
jgi:hypothetical protein